MSTNIDHGYTVQLCTACPHPGGQHLIDNGCSLCECPGWEPGQNGRWTDRLTTLLRQERRKQLRARAR